MHLLGKHLESIKEKENGLKTLNCFQKAAEKGYVPSLISLGEDSLQKKNAELALTYFQKALEQEDVDIFYEKWRLEKLMERCKKEMEIQANCSRAREIHKNLASDVILYPNAKQLDLNLHLKYEHLNILKQTLMDLKNQPLHVYGSNLSYEELILIRDAMIENPRITVVCPSSDGNSLDEAFYRIGYEKYLRKLKLYKKNKDLWSGFLFIGEPIKYLA